PDSRADKYRGMVISSRIPAVRQASSMIFSPAVPNCARDRHLLVFGQRFNCYARARDGDVKHLRAGRCDNAYVRTIAPDLIEFDPQFLRRLGVELVPSVEQQQYAAPFGEPEHVALVYSFERGTLMYARQ